MAYPFLMYWSAWAYNTHSCKETPGFHFKSGRLHGQTHNQGPGVQALDLEDLNA